jgi:hypothetical protein
MKKLIKYKVIFLMMFSFFSLNTAYSNLLINGNDDFTCTLTIKNSNGSKASSVRVKTDVSGGISCSGGRSF